MKYKIVTIDKIFTSNTVIFLEAPIRSPKLSQNLLLPKMHISRGAWIRRVTFVLFAYHPFLLPLYILKDQLHGKFKNFPRHFLGINIKSQIPWNFLMKKYLKMLRIDETTHFLKHFDLSDPFFPFKIVSIYHFWYFTFCFSIWWKASNSGCLYHFLFCAITVCSSKMMRPCETFLSAEKMLVNV